MGWLGLFSSPPRVQYQLEQRPTCDGVVGSGRHDYSSYRDLQSAVEASMQAYGCPVCGGHSVTGTGIVCTYGKVHLYQLQTVPGWLWGTRTKRVFTHTVWRWHDVLVAGSALLHCSCGWQRTAASQKRACRKCKGNGNIGGRCTTCGGAGEWICRYIQWEKTWWGHDRNAGECKDGYLYLPGYDCSRTICPACNGRAFVKCSACAGRGDGTSECFTCRGTGETY